MTAEELAALRPGDIVEWHQEGKTEGFYVVSTDRGEIKAFRYLDLQDIPNRDGVRLFRKGRPIGSETTADATSPLHKPPLGVMPRWLWIEQRCKDLERAIHERITGGRSLPHPLFDEMLSEWVDELASLISECKYLDEERKEKAEGKQQP